MSNERIVFMKRKLTIFVVFILIMTFACQSLVFATDISPYNNNTSTTTTTFNISTSGKANVHVNYMGYNGVTTGATISIKIEKRNLLLFWTDVVTETITVEAYRYDNNFYYQLEDSGTYRCTVEYVISGTGGADDVITFEDTASY